MSDFLTVEDVNSILLEYGSVSTFFECDTSLISSVYDFDEVTFDFLKVSKSTGDGGVTYSFEVENKLWTGGYYFLDSEGEYIDSDATLSDNVLSFTTDSDSVTLVLYLCNIAWEFYFERLKWRPVTSNNKQLPPNKIESNRYLSTFEDLELMELKENSLPASLQILKGNIVKTNRVVVHNDKKYLESIYDTMNGIIRLSKSGSNRIYWNNSEYHPKSMCAISLSTTKLYLGKINQIEFKLIYSPFYKLSDGILKYNGKETLIDLSNTNSRTFELDLTNRESVGNVKFSIHSNSVDGNYDWDYDFSLPCEILQASDYATLLSECGTGGTTILELGANISLSDDITVTHDIKIDGKGKSIDLNEHSLILNEGVKVTIKNVQFSNGDTSIIQAKNTELELNNCSFTNCTSTDYNNLGSVVYCDIDTESLTNPNDFITVIDNCTFTDNQNCILHGGRLTVTNCKFHNTDTDYIDKHNVAFLYQTDGNATLKGNVFDIDYDTDSLCSNELNIGFAQALVQCGSTARINGVTSKDLLEDNKLPFSDAVYQNASHIFAKYYYPQIETCVFTSPTLDREDKAVCYTVTGENWIFKQNVQVTRASWESENRIRKITWED